MKSILCKNGIDFDKLPTVQFTCMKSGCGVLFESDEYVVAGNEGKEKPVETCPICGSIVVESLQEDVVS
jgi:hypothetical protein